MPPRHCADETGRQRHEWHRQARLREEARSHARNREHRSNGDVNLARQDDERHAERDDENREVREKQVAEVVARKEAWSRNRQ